MPIMISMTRYYHNPLQFSRTFSVQLSIFKTLLPALFLAIACIVSSCEENPTSIGSGLLPGKDFATVKSTDTIGVGVYNQYVDSVYTNNMTYSYLGDLYDPYFGTTSTDFVAQLRLTQKWPGGDLPIVDDVELALTISGAKGTLDSTLHQIKISEIGEMLNSSTKYFSNRDPNIIKELGTFDLPGITKDTIQTLSVSLPVSVGEYLMRDTTKLEQEDDANDFRSFFRGVYVTLVDSPQPLIMAFSFSTATFVITVHYHNSNGEDLTYDFNINTNSVRYNRYRHDSTTALPENKIKHVNDGVKDTLSYLQTFNGVFPRIKIPGLSSFKSLMPISVNRATLVFSVYLDNTVYTTTTVPNQVLLSFVAADGSKNVLPDYLLSSSFFDGTFNATQISYTFNIATFIQLYLEGKIPKPELEMYYPEGEYKNVILKSNSSSAPVIFDFTYTTY
jgi:hypothetical protein